MTPEEKLTKIHEKAVKSLSLSWLYSGREAVEELVNEIADLSEGVEAHRPEGVAARGIEKKVCEDIASRQELGMKKYGVSVEDAGLSELEWLQHAYEEALDLSVYLKTLIEKQNDRRR